MKKITSIIGYPIKEEATNEIIDAMKNALVEEFNAWYGYIIVKEWLAGQDRVNISKFYEDTAKDELEDHAYWLMKRINQLGGTIEDISISPSSWENAYHEYIEPEWEEDYIPIKESLEINIKNEMGAIETYEELVEMTEDVDPVSNAKLKEILADEQEHLQELKDFLNDNLV